MAIEWTQEQQDEINRIVADRVNREKDKFKDYDTLKGQVDELSKLKEKLDLANKSEQERLVAEAVKAAEEKIKGTYEAQINDMKASSIRDKVLTGQAKKLPQAYASLVKTSANEDEVLASYKEVLKTFEEDMKALGITQKEIGSASNPGSQTTTTKKFSEMSMAEKTELYNSDPELYRQLRDGAK